MAHFAITDGRKEVFHSSERFSRSAIGLAGAQVRPFRVWLGDWELLGTREAMFPLTLRAEDGRVALDLVLIPEKPLVLQGDRGFSRKGPEPGNASFYYSFSRLTASGTLDLGGAPFPVEGSAWLDREWSTSALSGDQRGWDWFALQLDDGWDLMLYRIRDGNGEMDPYSDAVLIDPGGGSTRITADSLDLRVLQSWRSPLDGTEYPLRWSVSLLSRETALEVSPLIPDQEFAHTFRYWEGAVRVEGVRGGKPVSGVGYVEMTGYEASSSGIAAQVRAGRTGNR